MGKNGVGLSGRGKEEIDTHLGGSTGDSQALARREFREVACAGTFLSRQGIVEAYVQFTEGEHQWETNHGFGG